MREDEEMYNRIEKFLFSLSTRAFGLRQAASVVAYKAPATLHGNRDELVPAILAYRMK